MSACKFRAVFLIRVGSFCVVNIKLPSVSHFHRNAFREGHCVIHMMSNCSLPNLLCRKFFAWIKSLMPFIEVSWFEVVNSVSEGVAKHFWVPFVYTVHYTWIIDGLGYASYCLFGLYYIRPVFITVMHHWCYLNIRLNAHFVELYFNILYPLYWFNGLVAP